MSIMPFDWDEGCQTKEERGESRQIAQAVSQGKADFINESVHVCKHSKREVLHIGVTDFLQSLSLFNGLYMELQLICGTIFFFKIHSSHILSSPRAFIMALF